MTESFMPREVFPPDALEILIVEDSTTMAQQIQKVINRMLERFPGSNIQLCSSLKMAIAAIVRHAPDVLFLDLTLDDSGADETVEMTPFFDSHSPTLIVTGHDVDRIKKLLPVGLNDMPIVAKHDFLDTRRRGWLFSLILNTLIKWREKRNKQVDARIARNNERIREILAELAESDAPKDKAAT